MKKTLLLAGVACLFSFGANAADYSLSELRPYVGLDYVYTDANIKKKPASKPTTIPEPSTPVSDFMTTLAWKPFPAVRRKKINERHAGSDQV